MLRDRALCFRLSSRHDGHDRLRPGTRGPHLQERLLTRDLDNQESDFDIDPVARRDGQDRLSAFLVERGYAQATRTRPGS